MNAARYRELSAPDEGTEMEDARIRRYLLTLPEREQANERARMLAQGFDVARSAP